MQLGWSRQDEATVEPTTCVGSEKLYARTCFAEIANTNYEGEIRGQGDTVQIRTTPSIVINDYEIGGGLSYEKPTSDKVELHIDLSLIHI